MVTCHNGVTRSDVHRDSEGETDHGSAKSSEGESSSEEENDLEEDQETDHISAKTAKILVEKQPYISIYCRFRNLEQFGCRC